MTTSCVVTYICAGVCLYNSVLAVMIYVMIMSFIPIVFSGSPSRMRRSTSSSGGGGSGGGGGVGMEDLDWSKFGVIFKTRTNKLLFLQSLPGCVAWSVVSTFLADYLHTELQMSVRQATGAIVLTNDA